MSALKGSSAVELIKVMLGEAGKLHAVRTAGNSEHSIEAISRRAGRERANRELSAVCSMRACEARTRWQAGSPNRSAQKATTARGDEVAVVMSEHALSLNEKRKGMKKLLELHKEQEVEGVFIADPNLLVRSDFG